MVSVCDQDEIDELHVRIDAVNELIETLRNAAGGGTVLSIHEIASLLLEHTEDMVEDDLAETCATLAITVAILMQRLIFK